MFSTGNGRLYEHPAVYPKEMKAEFSINLIRGVTEVNQLKYCSFQGAEISFENKCSLTMYRHKNY